MEDEEGDRQQFEDVEIELPDLDDTQIIDEEQREVALYLDIRDGKVAGAETPPFLLPKRWTYETLRFCVEDYIQRRGVKPDKRLSRLYYKRAKGKAVVSLSGDGDIVALLNEYPLHYPSGKKKPSKVMYLAVEFEDKGDIGVRKSPRIQGHKHFDIFLHKYGDGKVSSTADTIHSVSSISLLADIIQQIVLLETSTTYLPQKGLYWLQKGSKQPVVLKTDADLELCKREYKNKGAIKLACEYLPSSPAGNPSTKSRKRKLDLDAASGSKVENDLWNDIHVSLVRDLEKKGIVWRYNISHLKLWTDMVYEGTLSGIGEEPIWQDHLEIVRVPPKSRRSSASPSDSSSTSCSSSNSSHNSSFSATSTNTNMMELLMLQNQQRMEMEAKKTEMFQTTLLALLGSNHRSMVPSSNFQNESSSPKEMPNNKFQETKAMKDLTREDVASILQGIGLQCYVETFKENDIDGPMLEAIADPIIGEGLLNNLGMHDKGHCQRLITEIYRAKFVRYK